MCFRFRNDSGMVQWKQDTGLCILGGLECFRATLLSRLLMQVEWSSSFSTFTCAAALNRSGQVYEPKA